MLTKNGKENTSIALGTLYFGTKIPLERCQELTDIYLSMGGNQIDTARCYASWLTGQDGDSEKAVGKVLKTYKREDIFLGTKGGIMPRGYNATRGNLSRRNIEKDLYASLEALETDYIDLYWLHRDDFSFTAGEIVEMMNELLADGKIRYYGMSNWTAERLMEACSYAKEHGLQAPSASQIQYGLGIATPGSWGDMSVVCMNTEEYAAYQKLQLPLYAYSAQAEGYFPIYLQKGIEGLSEDTRKKYDSPENRKRAAVLKKLLEKKSFSLSWLMAEYVLRSPFPAVFILGGSNPERVREIMQCYADKTSQLTDAEWDSLLS